MLAEGRKSMLPRSRLCPSSVEQRINLATPRTPILPRSKPRPSKRPLVPYESPWRYGRHAIWDAHLYPAPPKPGYSIHRAESLLVALQSWSSATPTPREPGVRPVFTRNALTIIESTPLSLSLWAPVVTGRRGTSAPPLRSVVPPEPAHPRKKTPLTGVEAGSQLQALEERPGLSPVERHASSR